MAEEKQHKASEKKLAQARKDGKVVKTALLTQAGVVTMCILSSFWATKLSLVRNASLLQYTLTEGYKHPEILLVLWAKEVGLFVLLALAPAAICAILLEASQVGFKVELGPLRVKPDRLNLVSGIANVFSGIRSSWQLLFRLAVFIPVSYWFIRGFVELAPRLCFMPLAQALQVLTRVVFKISGFGAALLVTAGGIEYLLRRKRFLAEMSMSDEEVRREYKENEGDPHVRSMRRALHESLLMQNMAKRVRESKVIVVQRA